MRPTKKNTPAPAKSSTPNASDGFTAEEKAAMRERARDVKAAARNADGESDVLAKIADMRASDRAMAERIHAIVMASAPELRPRTCYAMPACAKGDKMLCFFRDAQKFKRRYATFGFSDKANLDEGAMWPTDFALKEMTADAKARSRSVGALAHHDGVAI